MFRFVWILFSVTLVADIGILDSLKTRAIGEGGERVTLEIDNDNTVGKSKGVELNLPEKFDVKVLDWWITENGVKITNKFINKITSTPMVFHFNKNSFSFTSKMKLYLSVEQYRYYSSISGKGKFIKGKLTGKMISENWNYSKDILHFYDKYTSNLIATVKSDGKLYIVDTNTIANECKTRERTDKGWGSFKACSGEFLSSVHKIETDFQTHMILQLPINQSQSSQTFIPDTPTEAEPIQEVPQPVTISKTNLSAKVGVSANTQTQKTAPQTTYDPCKDPNQDAATKEYCANKAYNAKLDREEEAQDIAQEKAWEAEDKQEEADQKMLDEWYEEDRQTNIKHIERLEGQKKRSQEAEQKENKAFHDKLANDMQKRKDFQAEQQKNIKLINRFAPGDEWSDAYQEIKETDKTGDIQKSKELYSDNKKTYYDPHQERHIQRSKAWIKLAEEFDKGSKAAGFIKDTSLTINKGLAKLDPTGTGDKIVEIQENIGNLIEAAEKDGLEGVIVKTTSIVTNKFTNDIGGEVIEKTHKQIKDYNENGIKLDKSDKVYDKDGNKLTRYKKGDRAYNKNKEEISFSTGRRALSNIFFDVSDGKNPIKKAEDAVKNIKEGIAEGDFNKVVNAGFDLNDAKDSIDGGTDSAVKKLEGL